MCGIWAFLGTDANRTQDSVFLPWIQKLTARGPEVLKTFRDTNVYLGFTRLAINGLTEAGDQPIQDKDMIAICNGELYNYKELSDRHGFVLQEGASDCAVLPFLLRSMNPTEAFRSLDGVFATVIINKEQGIVYVARDPYGVRPLFEGRMANGGRIWSSELKGILSDCLDVKPFPPGTWRSFDLHTGNLLEEKRYHTIPWVKIPHTDPLGTLREALVKAVEKRLMSERPVGALLSGGLDSSLVAAIAAKKAKQDGHVFHTFSIGMPGSTDLMYAKKVADWIGSTHHEILLTKEDFLGAIEAVIAAIESYDITTVRASVGNWLVAKWIREHTDIKVVLNGDGSDEVGGGYLYFFKAPSDEAFEAETERLLEEIHLFDVLRSDRSISSHGLEARTPFLDKQFVASWLSLPTAMRRPVQGKQVEKWVLREAFKDTGLLPPEVLWRKKEAFSDGVSSTEESWYVTVGKHAAEMGLNAKPEWTHNPPVTPEGAYYREVFESLYPNREAVIPHMWMPRWIPGATDPSARTLKELY
jgi:asparagine synthase (glutamine-hydrolysing)